MARPLIQAINYHQIFLGKNLQNFAFFAAVFAGYYLDVIASLQVHII